MFVEIGKGGDVPLARIILKSHEDRFVYICKQITNDQLKYISDYSILNERLENPQKYMGIIFDNIRSIRENHDTFINRVFNIGNPRQMSFNSVIQSILEYAVEKDVLSNEVVLTLGNYLINNIKNFEGLRRLDIKHNGIKPEIVDFCFQSILDIHKSADINHH